MRQKHQKIIPECNGGHLFSRNPKKHHKSARYRFSNRKDLLVVQSKKAPRKFDLIPSKPGVREEQSLSSSNEFGVRKIVNIFLSEASKTGPKRATGRKKDTKGTKGEKTPFPIFLRWAICDLSCAVCTLNPVLLSPYSPPPLYICILFNIFSFFPSYTNVIF